MSNTDRVLKHLKEQGSITSMDAFRLYGATRLSAIVFNLKKYGHDIESIREESINRYGEPTHFVRYTYKGEK